MMITDRERIYPGNDPGDNLLEQLDIYSRPMPWIGMYIAAGCLVCTIAMAADVVYAFRWMKFWFPCKYFTLNAASLTILAIATKLSVDISSPIPYVKDKLAKLSNTLLMTTIMVKLVTSLGSMDGTSLLTNMIALAILAITIVVNIGIQLITLLIDELYFEEIFSAILMLIVLLISTHSALTIHATKKILEVKYRQVYKKLLNEEDLSGEGKLTCVELKDVLKKLWMMVETSNPQFVIGRSVASVSLAFVCLLNFLTYLEAWMRLTLPVRTPEVYPSGYEPACDYSWSIIWILVMQSIALVVCSLGPILRWFIFTSFKCIDKHKDCKEEFKIEAYWTDTLITWRKNPLPFQMGGRKCKKVLQTLKNTVVSSLIWFQILMVIINKISMQIASLPLRPLFWCFSKWKKHNSDSESDKKKLDSELDLAHYVLYLEGEVQLPRIALKMISYEVAQLIQSGTKVKSKNLTELLERSKTFNGVNQFDKIQDTKNPEEPPSCWTLPIMTLATIVVALIPATKVDIVHKFIRGVDRGLKYADMVDKALESKWKMGSIRNAVKVMWLDVELNHNWLDVHLREKSTDRKSTMEIMHALVDRADVALKKFKDSDEGSLMDPLDWPVEIIASDSMSRIGKTLMMTYEEGNFKNDDEKFYEDLHTMVADMLSACLTNLPHVMIQECFNCTIEKREDRVRRAALLTGETEEILELLEPRKVSVLDPGKAVCIREWLAFISQMNQPSSTVTPDNDEASPSTGEHISIDVPHESTKCM